MISNKSHDIANGLGFTFSGSKNNYSTPPENFIIEVIKETGMSLIKRETRFHSLLRTWIQTNARYLRTDSLKTLSIDLSDDQLRILGSFCAIARDNDAHARWFKLISFIQGRLNSKKIDIVPKEYPKEALDIFLKEFNIRYRNIPFQDERKFLGNQWLVKNNIWIRNRLLMTVSPRADLCSYFKLYKDRREKNICKFISIGRSSFFALKSDIELIQSL